MLILRTCKPDMTAYGGFQWPTSGLVVCPDWQNTKRCGNGLHGLRPGDAAREELQGNKPRKWLVVDAPAEHLVVLGDDKVKFPYCTVVFCSDDRDAALQYMIDRGVDAKLLPYTTHRVGDKKSIAVEGYQTAIAGQYGSAITADGGVASADFRGFAIGRDRSDVSSKDRGVSVTAHHGKASSGYGGVSIGSLLAKVTSGDYGVSIVGDGGEAVVGDCGMAIAGCNGIVSAGHAGLVVIAISDWTGHRYVSGRIGSDGLQPNTRYRLCGSGKFVAVEEPKPTPTVKLPATFDSATGTIKYTTAPALA